MSTSSFELVNAELSHDEMVDISECIQHHFKVYLNALEGAEGAQPHDLHQMLLTACEKPLLELVMEKTKGNQSLASEWLGINRATLRKKLLAYDLEAKK
ncbi:helix-turn-helix domain-containing protein [Hydromonas duriensis]|uniref:Putative Fis-like DNA-binding protein n=1 Tax=Hydromonas duriensis TaxID=1527608 RepID=A0A4R6Y3F0_9BURK|nr:DNA-binding protein Fis [Hydromonas duriensis]